MRSVQELNEYLTSVSNPIHQAGIEGKQLTFYVKPDHKEMAPGKKGDEGYKKFTIELLPLKGQVAHETKKAHYTK